jgi:uncharacterized YigZ family protein
MDTYRTISGPSEGVFKDKGSRFIARAYPVATVDEVKEILAALRKEFHDARHHCYAYRLGPGGAVYRVNDDGEPSSSAGKPILGQLQSFELTNVLIVVVRYFGGVLLGVGGLINAYRSASRLSLESAQVLVKTFNSKIAIRFPYAVMSDVMRAIKDNKAEIIRQDFSESCLIEVEIRTGMADSFSALVTKIEGVQANMLPGE